MTTEHEEKVFRRQIVRCRKGIDHLNKAADLFEKARIDDVPDDVRELSKEIADLMDGIESHLNPPSAKIFQIRDFQAVD